MLYICITNRKKERRVKLNRNNNNVTLVDSEAFTNMADMVSAAIDVYSGLTLVRGAWLTEREKDFFICVVLFKHMGYNKYNDEKSLLILNKYFGEHRSQERSIYLGKLEDKKWVKVDADKNISMPPFFDSINLEQGTVEFNLKFSLDRQEPILTEDDTKEEKETLIGRVNV